MQKTLLHKFLMIGGLMLLILIPLSMINGVINERERNRDFVVSNISKSSTGAQRLDGALVVVPYKETVQREVEEYQEGELQTVVKTFTEQRYKYFLPELLDISGDIQTEKRYRGIYEVPVYTANLKLKGHFTIPKHLGITENLSNIHVSQSPYMVFGIKDVRGINQAIKVRINDAEANVEPGSKTIFVKQGVHAAFGMDVNAEQTINFTADFMLDGMKSLTFLPTGEYTKIDISSPWQHPSFIGNYLPKTRDVSAEGFNANWETSFFASNMQQHFANCAENNQCRPYEANGFGVSLHEGVDVYLQAERSIKYALLFVGLTFVAFFLFEVLKGLRIHVIQYGLVGVAMALFYLLLVSLSEHIAFGLSYVIASMACVSLLGFYVSAVLGSVARGATFGGSLAGLYGALYVLISSEDTALLMGSGLIFAVLTFIMIITRNVDWYKIGAAPKPTQQTTTTNA